MIPVHPEYVYSLPIMDPVAHPVVAKRTYLLHTFGHMSIETVLL